MDKRLSVFYSLVALVMLGMAVFRFIGPDERPRDYSGLSRMDATRTVNPADDGPRYAAEIDLIAGICALFLVGYLFWACYRKFQKDSRADLATMENTLYKISLTTGRNEYDLFQKSAEKWSVSGDRIDRDFRRYMTDQVLPYYAKDFVRKNQARIDESLINKKEVKPASWSDWAKALLVFPGSFLLLLSMAVFL